MSLQECLPGEKLMLTRQNLKDYQYNWMHLGIALVFLFPLFTNTVRHWASSTYVLLVLVSLFSIKHYRLDLKKEEKIFLAIIVLHVLTTVISNVLAGWTRASHSWFFSGDLRLLFAVPVYLYLRGIPGIWKYFLAAVPIGAVIIGVTGIVDFMLRYISGDVGMIFAEGIYGHIFQGNISVLWSVLSFAAYGYYKDSRKMRMLCLAGAVFGALGALVSVTRNAWLSLILLYMLIFILQGGAIRTIKAIGARRLVFVSIALLPMLYFLSGIEYVNARFSRVFEEPVEYFNADRSKPIRFTSIGFRLEQWRGALYAFEEKPVFGHGVGNAGVVHNRYVKEGRLNVMVYQKGADLGNPTHTHSVYFSYLGDKGIVGTVLIVLLLFYPFYVAVKSRHRAGQAWKFQVLLSASFILASLTEHPFVRNNWTSVFIVCSVVIFIWMTRSDEVPEGAR
ncbi:MAG: O-antigen ligase family protein [Thiotrichales bacterium]|nr:MAG: O-antigen ligase family protein [Thiotrichales bacterium]